LAFLTIDCYSHVLMTEMQVSAILPDETPAPWRTLYLLHGLSDDHTAWMRQTSIERYANERGLAVVMPSAHTSYYTDMALGLKYFTYIARELPRVMRQMLPGLSHDRRDNWAAGLSMGGYGALKCALRAPETFSMAASLSGGVDPARRTADDPARRPFWEDIFGPLGAIPGSSNDLFTAAQQLKDAPERPRLWMWCGTEDFLYPYNVALRDRLYALGYDLTYTESPGSHQWKYWDREIVRALDWFIAKREEM